MNSLNFAGAIRIPEPQCEVRQLGEGLQLGFLAGWGAPALPGECAPGMCSSVPRGRAGVELSMVTPLLLLTARRAGVASRLAANVVRFLACFT